MSKYYTPTIEEFYVGFEYEFNSRDYDMVNMQETWEWTKRKYHHVDFIDKNTSCFQAPCVFNKFKERIRVKYLDREDIESLGFTYDKTSSEGQLKFFKGNLCLFYRPESKEIGTFTIDPAKNDYMIKYGRDNRLISTLKIKNKSELKRILKQLGT